MKIFSRTVLLVFAVLIAASLVFAQEESGARWRLAFSKPAPAVGDEIDVIVTAGIAPGWIVYSSEFKAALGPQPTRFTFSPDKSYELIGEIVPVKPKRKTDRTWDTEFTYFEERAEFRQKIRVLKKDLVLAVQIKGQLCNEHEGSCTLFEQTVAP